MANYDNFASTFAKSRKNMSWGELDAILEDISKNNFTKILDVWCGSGRLLEFYTKKFENLPEKYLGVDNSFLIVEEAKKQFPEADFFVSEMQDFDEKFFEKYGKFDAIVLLASFHHLSDISLRKTVLQNLKTFLSPHGKIYMTNWNLREQEKYKKSEKGVWEFYIKIGEFERYYHGFMLDELENLFLENNFIIEKNEVFEGGRNFLSIINNPK